MSDAKFEIHFHGPVGQNINNVEHMDVHVGKDGKVQVMNAEQVTASKEEQPETFKPSECGEVTEGTMEQHLQIFKEALLKAQDVKYGAYAKMVTHSYDWVAAERLGKDLGILNNYDELANLLKDKNFREVPGCSQNLTPYRSIIAEKPIYPSWQCKDLSKESKFRKFLEFANTINSIYKLGCENKHIKPFGSL